MKAHDRKRKEERMFTVRLQTIRLSLLGCSILEQKLITSSVFPASSLWNCEVEKRGERKAVLLYNIEATLDTKIDDEEIYVDLCERAGHHGFCGFSENSASTPSFQSYDGENKCRHSNEKVESSSSA